MISRSISNIYLERRKYSSFMGNLTKSSRSTVQRWALYLSRVHSGERYSFHRTLSTIFPGRNQFRRVPSSDRFQRFSSVICGMNTLTLRFGTMCCMCLCNQCESRVGAGGKLLMSNHLMASERVFVQISPKIIYIDHFCN